MPNGYIGLSVTRPDPVTGANFTEPPRESGYCRVPAGEISITEIPELLHKFRVVFNDVTGPGYGNVCAAGFFVEAEGGAPWYIWPLEPVEVHPDVVPVIHKGRLLLGVDVTARILIHSTKQTEVGA